MDVCLLIGGYNRDDIYSAKTSLATPVVCAAVNCYCAIAEHNTHTSMDLFKLAFLEAPPSAIQVMVACEPSDTIMAVLLETNDQLLSAVTGWDATAQRLAMLQSQQPAAASNHASSSNSASAVQIPNPDFAQLPNSSSAGNGSLNYPTAALTSAGGSFWDRLQPQADQSHGSRPQLQPTDATPQRAQDFASSSGRRVDDTQPENSIRQATAASNSYLDELGGPPVSRYPHQQVQSGDDTWQPFGAGPAQPSGPASASGWPQQASHSQAVNGVPRQQHAGYQGSVLSYALKQQPSQEASQVTDPLAGMCCTQMYPTVLCCVFAGLDAVLC